MSNIINIDGDVIATPEAQREETRNMQEETDNYFRSLKEDLVLKASYFLENIIGITNLEDFKLCAINFATQEVHFERRRGTYSDYHVVSYTPLKMQDAQDGINYVPSWKSYTIKA